MNTRNLTSAATIQLNETFLRLISGAANVGDIIAERAAARAATLASEDGYARRRRLLAELADPFTPNFCR